MNAEWSLRISLPCLTCRRSFLLHHAWELQVPFSPTSAHRNVYQRLGAKLLPAIMSEFLTWPVIKLFLFCFFVIGNWPTQNLIFFFTWSNLWTFGLPWSKTWPCVVQVSPLAASARFWRAFVSSWYDQITQGVHLRWVFCVCFSFWEDIQRYFNSCQAWHSYKRHHPPSSSTNWGTKNVHCKTFY